MKLQRTILLAFSVIATLFANDKYYETRDNVIGFQDFRSNLPNQLLPTPKERRQAYRMGFFYVPKGITEAVADKEAKWYKDAGFNMVLGDKYRMLIIDLVPEEANKEARRPIDQIIRDTRIFFQAVHKHGMETMHHVTCTMVPQVLLAKHPDWAAINLNTGKTDTNTYGTGNTCINNDEYWNLWFARLERLLKESPADAVMIDEIQFFAPYLCGCASCREKFHNDTGFELPPNGQFKGWGQRQPEVLRRWRRWRGEKVLERQQQCRRLLKSLNSQAVFSAYQCNNTTSYNYYSFALEPSNLATYADSVGLESMPHGLDYAKYHPLVIFELKFLHGIAEHTGNAPWVLFYGKDSFADMLTGMLGFFTGTRQWWWQLGKQEFGWRPLLQWEVEHEALLTDVHPAANVAILCSSNCRNFNAFGSSEWELGMMGLANALTDLNIPYRVITDMDFKDSNALRKKADTVIAMNAQAWTKEGLVELEKFVRAGGTLITSGDFSRADDIGNKLENFAASKLLGFDYAGEIATGKFLDIPKANPVTGDTTGQLPYSRRIIKLKNIAKDMETLGSFIAKDGSSHPGILTRKVGQGRIVYFAGSPERCSFFHFYNTNLIKPGQEWKDQRNPQWSTLLAKVANAYNENVIFKAGNFPQGVLVEAYRQDNGKAKGIQLQMLNFQSMRAKGGLQPLQNTYDFPSAAKARPDKGKPMTLDVLAPATKKAYLFSVDFDEMVEWPFTRKDDRILIEIPEIYRHLVLYLSSGDDAAFNIPGRKLVKAFPQAKPLRREVRPALAAPYNPETATAFSEGKAFSGGVLRNAWHLSEPIRIIYGTRSGKNEMNVKLQLAKAMQSPVLELGAMCDDVANSKAPVTIELDGQNVFTGKVDFPDNRWGVRQYPLPMKLLEAGEHTLRIVNTGNGPINNIPWLGVAYCRIRPAGMTLHADFGKGRQIPVYGQFADVKGNIDNGALRFGSENSGARFPADKLAGKQGTISFKFRIEAQSAEAKVPKNLVMLRPSSLASLAFTINGGKQPKLAITFYHPIKKEGALLNSKQVLDFGKEYTATAVWDGKTVRGYLDGELIGEGAMPPITPKFNDLFIGPFQDKWIKCPAWNDSATISELKVWNTAIEPK
ncbi:MAG: hypothetical protein J5746_03085 [Victivallales bacterium]|nr:hypothetical protein [Victivallales bacterium]